MRQELAQLTPLDCSLPVDEQNGQIGGRKPEVDNMEHGLIQLQGGKFDPACRGGQQFNVRPQKIRRN